MRMDLVLPSSQDRRLSQRHVSPSSQGQAREVPVQEHVDEYEVIGPDGYGYPIYALKENHKALYGGLISEEDMAKAYDDANPYENRDPRFYRDITYHGAMFKGASGSTPRRVRMRSTPQTRRRRATSPTNSSTATTPRACRATGTWTLR